MRRALVVVSAFAPALVADMHRARMLAWELPRCGWDVEVLAPAPGEVRQDIIEEAADQFFPPGLVVHYFGSFARALFEALGSRSPAWRALWPLYRRGEDLLRTGRFDLVFFSTTTFPFFAVAARWRRKFGIPYVLDIHDPWIKEDRRRPAAIMRRLAHGLSERIERSAVADADGLISVSEAYVGLLSERYRRFHPRWYEPGKHAVIPFGALQSDLGTADTPLLRSARRTQLVRIAYVGAGGKIMARSFDRLCRVLLALRRQGVPAVERLRIELYGTMYGWRDGEPRHLQDIADEAGVGDLVCEQPQRVSYRRSIELLLQADGALVLGVDDEGYVPSKLFQYAMSGKPLLLCLHAASPAHRYIPHVASGTHVLTFGDGTNVPGRRDHEAGTAFLEDASARRTFDRTTELEPFLAPSMARRHAELFGACVTSTQERMA